MHETSREDPGRTAHPGLDDRLLLHQQRKRHPGRMANVQAVLHDELPEGREASREKVLLFQGVRLLGKEATLSRSWSDRIKKLIQEKGSIEAVAAELGVTFYSVLRWRNGAHRPSKLAQKQIVELEKEVSR